MFNYEYVTVNNKEDLWIVYYDTGLAIRKTTINIDDLNMNGDEYSDQFEDTIIDYLENNGFVIDMDHTTETRIEFRE